MAMTPVEAPLRATNVAFRSQRTDQQRLRTASSQQNNINPGYVDTDEPANGSIPGPLQPAYGPGDVNIQNVSQLQLNGKGRSGGSRRLQFMARPIVVPGVPAGLEYLTQIDQLIIHQQVEMFEESNAFERRCCGAQRGFKMHITDNLAEEVICVTRTFKCMAGWNCCACCDCGAMEVQIEAPLGQIIGHVRQLPSCLNPKFAIIDAHGQTVLNMEGPGCACRCCQPEQEFQIMSISGQKIGRVLKQWGGFMKEYFTNADNFLLECLYNMDKRSASLHWIHSGDEVMLKVPALPVRK